MLEARKEIFWNTELTKFGIWESTKNWQFCPVVGKNPASVAGKDWYNTDFKVAEPNIFGLLNTGKATGFGVKLGKASNGLMCADIDGQPAIDLFKSYGLELTIASSSREGSEAYYFQVPEQYWDLISRDEIKTGQTYTKPDGTVAESKIELRWGVMQQVMPPSIHPLTNEPYRWINSPEDAPLAIAPDQFIELMMLKKQGGAKPVESQYSRPTLGFDRIPLDKVISKEHRDFMYGVSSGGRNISGFSLACDLIGAHDWLIQNGYTPLDDPYYLFQVFGGRCNPPIDGRELEAIWKSANKEQRSPSLPDEYIQNCVNGFLKVKQYPKVHVVRNDNTGNASVTKVRFKINLSNLCSLPSRRVFQGTSTIQTAASLMAVYRELREWELSLAMIAPDTAIISSPRKIIDKVAERWQIEAYEIEDAITELGEIKTRIGSNDDRIDMVRLYRTRIVEGVGDTPEEIQKDIEKKEKQEYFNMCERVTAWFRTNLLFNQQIEMWHRYVNGVWKVATDKEIKAEARQLLTDLGMSDSNLKGAKVSDDRVTNFVKEIQSAVLIERLDAIKEYKHLINMQDGVLNRRTKQLLPHDRKYMFSWQLPYKWEDRHIGAKIIQDWMSWTFEHEDQIKLLLCWLNATICERVDIQKVLQLVGAGGAGKSTFSKLAMALTGVSNVHQSSIELMDTQFEPSNFIGKKLIAISEIGEYRGSGTTLKKVTGRDRIPNQIKFQQARNSGFTYKGQMIIIANKEFAPHDSGSSFDRRNICVPFNKVIANAKKRNLIEIDDDGTISGEFAPCLPAFLEMVLDITDKEVTNFLNETTVYVPSLNDAATNSILNGDTLAQWVEDNLVAIQGAKTYVGKAELHRTTEMINGKSVTKNVYANEATHLFANYVAYCSKHGAKDKDSVNMQNFSRRLLDLFSGTLRNQFVKKAHRDKYGCAILGLAIRTPEHANIPSPIKGVVFDEEPMYEAMNTQTQQNENIPNNGDLSQTPIPPTSNSSFTTTTSLPIEESSNNLQSFHSIGFQVSPTDTPEVHQSTTQENITKGDQVEISIPQELISHPQIIEAQKIGAIPPSGFVYVVSDIYTIDGATYIGVVNRQGQECKVYVEYVRRVG